MIYHICFIRIKYIIIIYWLNNSITYVDIPYDYVMINNYVIYRTLFKFPKYKLSNDNILIKWHNNMYGCTIWLYHMIKWLMVISYIHIFLIIYYIYNICINNKNQRYIIYLLLLSKWAMLTIYCYLLLNKKYTSRA